VTERRAWLARAIIAILVAGSVGAAPAFAQQARDSARARGEAKTDSAALHRHDMMDMPGMKMGGDSAMHMGHEGMAGMHGPMRVPPMPKGIEMQHIPGMDNVTPNVTPFLPGAGVDPSTIPAAVPMKVAQLKDGDTLDLTAGLVRRTLRGKTYTMYGFNGQYPGPLIRVKQNATITVRFTNKLDMPSSVHWHGVRLDNRSDGAVGVTQDAVPPGGHFTYTVHFVDAGLYWYHPHVREDIQQGLGLFGNMLVDSPDPNYYSPVNAEEMLLLDDLLVDDEGIFPFGKEAADFAIMGRFGNMYLINGEPDYHLEVHRGDVVRFFVTNVSNARMYNLNIGGAALKLVGADLGKYEREVMVPNVVVAPAQRYIVEARFDTAGTFAITNRVQGLNNFLGVFVPIVDTLGKITVAPTPSSHDYRKQFATLRENHDVTADIEQYRRYFDKPPDKELLLTVNIQGLAIPLTAFMSVDTMYYPPAEWVDGMPDMNWASSSKEVHWIMRDLATGRENMDINDWNFKRGDLVKIRITNDGTSMHPMNHPIHFHGQRFLVIARNGVPQENLVWRDTAVIPVGTSADILLEASNPGKWMAHCHIAEHLDAGMHMVFTVAP
jgi:FtsP/CotA-like multicopper oxidase with cupredoxin domain